MAYKYNVITGEFDLVMDGGALGAVTQIDTDSGTVSPSGGTVNLNGDATQGVSTSGSGNTAIITVADATESQKGVIELATAAETTTGTSSSLAIHPSGLNSKLGAQTSNGLIYGQGGAGSNLGALAEATNGQLPIGSTGNPPLLSTLTDTEYVEVTNGTGSITIDLTDNAKHTAINGWNGSIIETIDVSISSDGATITLSVEKNGGGDLTVVFSDGFYSWDTTPADTVTLTAGTDASPVLNSVYFLQSTKTLVASTSGFPDEEHAPIAEVVCQSASSLQTQGPYKQQNWTDHIVGLDNQGHIGHLNFWIRQQSATYVSGILQSYNITTNVGTPDNVTLETQEGIVLQLHDQTFPAFTNPIDYYVANDFTSPYTTVTDLNALLTDSTGASMQGKYFSLVIWGVASKEGSGYSKLFVNLPGGSYNTSTEVLEDLSLFANYTIPSEFKNTGFLISEWKLRHQNASGGTWTSIDEIDLRGLFPSLNATGSSSLASEFPDSTFRIFDNVDDTREIAFDAGSITTGNVRTITMADNDIDLANVVINLAADSGTAVGASNSITVTGSGGITTSASGSTLTIVGSSESLIPVTLLDNTDSPYTVLTSDYYMSCDVSVGVLQIELPDAPTTGKVWIVKDSDGNAATNNITVTTAGGVVTIDGSTTFVMNTDYQSAQFVFNGTSYEVF